jgi:hypothetical protein
MNSSVRSFVMAYLRVVLATLMVVAFTAFISLPYVLGRPLGHEPASAQTVDRHMT